LRRARLDQQHAFWERHRANSEELERLKSQRETTARELEVRRDARRRATEAAKRRATEIAEREKAELQRDCLLVIEVPESGETVEAPAATASAELASAGPAFEGSMLQSEVARPNVRSAGPRPVAMQPMATGPFGGRDRLAASQSRGQLRSLTHARPVRNGDKALNPDSTVELGVVTPNETYTCLGTRPGGSLRRTEHSSRSLHHASKSMCSLTGPSDSLLRKRVQATSTHASRLADHRLDRASLPTASMWARCGVFLRPSASTARLHVGDRAPVVGRGFSGAARKQRRTQTLDGRSLYAYT
jgi:hypothetical protein